MSTLTPTQEAVAWTEMHKMAVMLDGNTDALITLLDMTRIEYWDRHTAMVAVLRGVTTDDIEKEESK